jgi:glycosyltransferase involved in cell wall biosynthesis
MTWTLSVSTLITPELRILNFIEKNRDKLAAFDEVLLVCQVRAHPMPMFPTGFLPANCRLIESVSVGISASRNVGLDHFRGDVIWFMDDDVLFGSNLSEIKATIESSSADFNTLRIQDTQSDALYKRYGPERDLGALDLLQVSSIEITCRKSFLERTGLRFPEWIGVGTPLPSGEENLFLNQALKRGARIRHLPLVGCHHPRLAPEMKAIWSRPNRTTCMGIVARQYGLIGLLLCARWFIRGLGAGVKTRALIDLWRGYFGSGNHVPKEWSSGFPAKAPVASITG